MYKNRIDIAWDSKLYDCKFNLGCHGGVMVKDNCHIRSLSINTFSSKSLVVIGGNCFINGGHRCRVIMNANEDKNIVVGNDCIFSNNIELHTTDYHSVLDTNGKRTNIADNIVIGNHVWVGLRCLILKGVNLADGCIVGAGSIVTKSVKSPNTLIGGIPAHSLRSPVYWDIRRIINQY